jgi:hypothetical protein
MPKANASKSKQQAPQGASSLSEAGFTEMDTWNQWDQIGLDEVRRRVELHAEYVKQHPRKLPLPPKSHKAQSSVKRGHRSKKL